MMNAWRLLTSDAWRLLASNCMLASGRREKLKKLLYGKHDRKNAKTIVLHWELMAMSSSLAAASQTTATQVAVTQLAVIVMKIKLVLWWCPVQLPVQELHCVMPLRALIPLWPRVVTRGL